MSSLLHQRCRAISGGAPMSDVAVHNHLAQVSGWHRSGKAIEKVFSFHNYHETIAFVNALAWIAHTEDHHPDLAVSYDRCVVRYSTHSAGGVTVNDFICAAKVDALIPIAA